MCYHRPRLHVLLLAIVLAGAASPARGQSPKPGSLRDQLLSLGRVTQDPVAQEQINAFAGLVVLETSTAPYGTSAGGFTFHYDPRLKVFVRSSESFGPLFVQRSLTIGKGKWGAGFNVLHAGYDSLNGSRLDNGDLLLTRNVRLAGDPTSYTRDTFDFHTDTTVAFGNYGVTDNFDISAAVPWVRVSVAAQLAAFTSSNTLLGTLPLPQSAASGIGDIAIQGKYRFWKQEGGGLATALRVRLPTGDTDNLRGSGVTRTFVSGIWSKGGTFSPHAEFGYEFWSDKLDVAPDRSIFVKDDVTYAIGAEWTPNPRLTTVLDFLGEHFRHGGSAGYLTFVEPGRGSLEALTGVPGGLTKAALAPGFKWNAYGSGLITGGVLLSLHNKGLRANVIPVIGLDWAF